MTALAAVLENEGTWQETAEIRRLESEVQAGEFGKGMQGAPLTDKAVRRGPGLLGKAGEYKIITFGSADVLLTAVWISDEIRFGDEKT